MAEYHTDDNRTTGFLTGCWNRLRRLWYSPASGGKPSGRKALGDAGEHAAAKLYRRQGSRVLERNYTCKRGEIDIIALDRDVVCFIEVKTRRPNSLLPPERNVTIQKQHRIRAIARHYLRARRLRNQVCRFDIAAVTYPEQGPPEIKIIKNAF